MCVQIKLVRRIDVKGGQLQKKLRIRVEACSLKRLDAGLKMVRHGRRRKL